MSSTSCTVGSLYLPYTQSKNYKMLSTSIFNHNGTVYDQAAVFGKNGILNETALEEYGLPAMTGSNAWANFAQNLAVCVSLSHGPLLG